MQRLRQHHHRRHQSGQDALQYQTRQQSRRAAAASAIRTFHRERTEQFGDQQQGHSANKHPHGADRVDHRPLRKQRAPGWKVIRRHKSCLHARRQNGNVLQIALAPAAVADCQVGERRGTLLITAAQRGHHVDRPAGAAHQCGLDKVVAHDQAAERFSPRQFRQAGGFGESTRADQRIVAPIIALGAVPPGDAMRDQRPIDAAGELLQPSEQRGATRNNRQGLDQAHPRMLLYRIHQADQRVGAHHAVGVQDEELRICGAEPRNPVGNIPRLARGVAQTVAIEDAVVPASAGAQRQERGFLLDPGIGIGGIAENEDVERLARRTGCLQSLPYRLQAGRHPLRRFIISRHQQRGARRRNADLRRQQAPSTAGQ